MRGISGDSTWHGTKSIDGRLRSTRRRTACQVDLRPRILLSLQESAVRSLDAAVLAVLHPVCASAPRLRPREPSLTPRAVKQLTSLLNTGSVGAEWGSGNTTRWFAKRTKHLTSFETTPAYYEQVAASLRADGLTNVDYRLIPHDFEGEDDEDEMHRNAYVSRGVPTSPTKHSTMRWWIRRRGVLLCEGVAPKLKHGELLILDKATIVSPPPANPIRPPSGSVSMVIGTPGSKIPSHKCWPALRAAHGRLEAGALVLGRDPDDADPDQALISSPGLGVAPASSGPYTATSASNGCFRAVHEHRVARNQPAVAPASPQRRDVIQSKSTSRRATQSGQAGIVIG